jgi:shikimate kinase
MNLYLIGYRCCGKTSVGKMLAGQTGRQFIDCDTMLVDEAAMSIKQIVDSRGWEVFRGLEQKILKRVCRLNDTVVATGGGVVTNAENVQHMKKSGVVIWLKAEPDTVKKRILQDHTTDNFRPSLSAKGVLKEIEETLESRLPLYEAAMDFCVQTDDVAVDAICRSIHEKLPRFIFPA